MSQVYPLWFLTARAAVRAQLYFQAFPTCGRALLPGVLAVGVFMALPKVEPRLKGTQLCGLYDRRTKLGGLQTS